MKSPVKVRKFKRSKGGDFYYNENSDMEDDKVDYDVINYVMMKSFNWRLFTDLRQTRNITLSPTIIIKGKKMDVYCVTDGTAIIQLCDWESSNLIRRTSQERRDSSRG